MLSRPCLSLSLALLCGVFTAFCAPLRAGAEDGVTVFAAASLGGIVATLAAVHEAETGVAVRVSAAGSSALARQIEYGAPADIFISANAAWMDRLEAQGLIEPDSRRDFAGNRLVLIAPAGNTADAPLASAAALLAALKGGKLAMALTEAVPAGIYGKAALKSSGLWESTAPHIVQTDNVRAALRLVAAGHAPLGIVYASDAASEPAVRIAALFPQSSHPAISYPAALLPGAPQAARVFFARLFSQAAQTKLAALGFLPPPAPQ